MSEKDTIWVEPFVIFTMILGLSGLIIEEEKNASSIVYTTSHRHERCENGTTRVCRVIYIPVKSTESSRMSLVPIPSGHNAKDFTQEMMTSNNPSNYRTYSVRNSRLVSHQTIQAGLVKSKMAGKHPPKYLQIHMQGYHTHFAGRGQHLLQIIQV